MSKTQRMLIRLGVWKKFVDNYDRSFSGTWWLPKYLLDDNNEKPDLYDFIKVATPRDALNYGFEWKKTKEGYNFWYSIYKDILSRGY